MKVFISSVITGYEHFRNAAAAAARVLGHQVIRAEDFAADPNAPQQVCLKGVREADAVLLLMGSRYGYVVPSGLSATQEEYREAKERKPILAFVENAPAREPEQQAFVGEVQSYVAGHFRAAFSTELELKDAITLALHRYELSLSSGPVDEQEMLARAENLPVSGRGMALPPTLYVAVAGGPRQQVLRPVEVEAPALARKIMQEATYGQEALFDAAFGTKSRLDQGALVVEQVDHNAWIRIDELGTVQIAIPARGEGRRNFSDTFALIEEDVLQKIGQALRFSGWLLSEIDPVSRLSDVVIVASLAGASYMGWQTRGEAAASGGSVQGGKGGEWTPVRLSPPRRNRAALVMDHARIAEDLVTLLRREVR